MTKDLVYLSGGVSKNPNYRKDFKRGQTKMEKAGFAVINPVEIFKGFKLKDHDAYMKVCLPLLEQADHILMLCGWSTSEGAVAEHNHAKLHNISIMYEDGAERS